MDDAEADIEPATHPAGICPSRRSAARLEVERGEDLGVRGPSRRRLAHAVQPALEHEFATAGLGRVGRAALRHVADPLADLLRLAAEVGAGHRRLTRCRRDERREHAQRGGLAGAVGAEEAEDLARADVQVDASARPRRRPLAADLERPPQVAVSGSSARSAVGVVMLTSPCPADAVVWRRHLRRSASSGNICSSADIYPSGDVVNHEPQERSIPSSARCGG